MTVTEEKSQRDREIETGFTAMLKPCPVCGSAARYEVGHNDYHWIECTNTDRCGISIDSNLRDAGTSLMLHWNCLPGRSRFHKDEE